MKFKLLHFLVVAVIFSVGTISGQNAADAAKAVKLRLSFAGGKTVYRIGEPIKLILSYVAEQPGYAVETYYSPRFDDVIVSPTDGVYDWLYRLNRLYSYDDVSVGAVLSQSPVEVEITINDLVRFDKPGKYKIKVLSRRVWIPQKENSFRQSPIPLLSNEIEFEVKEMTEAEERVEVKRITGLMDSAQTLAQHQTYKRELDYLTGDVSTAEKVNRFLNPPVFNGISWLDSGKGLDIARNKTLAIKLLENVLRDPQREVSRELINKLATLRVSTEHERQPSQATDSHQLRKEHEPRFDEIRQNYYDELLESLPKRAGKNRIVAAYTIFTALPKTDVSSLAYSTTKTLLLEKFDELKHYDQSHLLEHYWDKINNPSLISALEKILANEEPSPNWSNRANAFKRLIEIDDKRARSFVIDEIRDPDSLMNPDFLTTLDDAYLPETDDALLEQITKLASTNDPRMRLNLQFKLRLAARYATAKIYKELLGVYKKHVGSWSLEQRAPLLSYLARHDDEEAIPLIEELLNKSGDRSGSIVFYHLTKTGFSEGLEKLLQKRLESDEPETAGTAAYHLSKYGSAENKSLIEKRYNRWLTKWSGRRSELENPDAGEAIKSEPMFQVNLLEALIRAEKWKLSETEIARLKLTCLTENCRRHFSIR